LVLRMLAVWSNSWSCFGSPMIWCCRCSFGRLSSGGYYWNLALYVSFPNACLFMCASLMWWSLTCTWCCSFNRRHLWRSHKQFLHGRWGSLVATFSLDLFQSHAWSAVTLTLYVIIACFNIIEKELRLPLDMIFSEISPEPVAAASLGQVRLVYHFFNVFMDRLTTLSSILCF
jgi:hypothetical protein